MRYCAGRTDLEQEPWCSKGGRGQAAKGEAGSEVSLVRRFDHRSDADLTLEPEGPRPIEPPATIASMISGKITEIFFGHLPICTGIKKVVKLY